MKNNIYNTFLLLCIVITTNAQMIIAEENNYPRDVTESSLLQFEDNKSKGIILPANTTDPVSPVNGTFIFNIFEESVKVFENDKWIYLTDRGKAPTFSNESDRGEGVIIGADKSVAEGVLVLESSDKALVLPRVNNVNRDVVNPYPGMICYDLATKTMTIFDGIQWNYWK